VADPARQRIWVCEIKDPESAFAPYTLRRHLERFTPGQAAAQTSCSPKHTRGGQPWCRGACLRVSEQLRWRVIPQMITRRVEPAAFVRNLRIAFTVIADLLDVIDADEEPVPGHAPISGASDSPLAH